MRVLSGWRHDRGLHDRVLVNGMLYIIYALYMGM